MREGHEVSQVRNGVRLEVPPAVFVVHHWGSGEEGVGDVLGFAALTDEADIVGPDAFQGKRRGNFAGRRELDVFHVVRVIGHIAVRIEGGRHVHVTLRIAGGIVVRVGVVRVARIVVVITFSYGRID